MVDSRATEFSRILSEASKGSKANKKRSTKTLYGNDAEEFSEIQTVLRPGSNRSGRTKASELSAIQSQLKPNKRPGSRTSTFFAIDSGTIGLNTNSWAQENSRGNSTMKQNYSEDDDSYGDAYEDTSQYNVDHQKDSTHGSRKKSSSRENRNEPRNSSRGKSSNPSRSKSRDELRNEPRSSTRNKPRSSSRNQPRSSSRNQPRSSSRNQQRNQSRDEIETSWDEPYDSTIDQGRGGPHRRSKGNDTDKNPQLTYNHGRPESPNDESQFSGIEGNWNKKVNDTFSRVGDSAINDRSEAGDSFGGRWDKKVNDTFSKAADSTVMSGYGGQWNQKVNDTFSKAGSSMYGKSAVASGNGINSYDSGVYQGARYDQDSYGDDDDDDNKTNRTGNWNAFNDSFDDESSESNQEQSKRGSPGKEPGFRGMVRKWM